MNHPILRTLACISVGILLAACGPESKNPLSSPAGATADPRLEGVWVSTEKEKDDSAYYLHFHRHRDPGNAALGLKKGEWTDLISVEHSAKSGLDLDRYSMFPTQLAGRSYMNVLARDNSEKKHVARHYLLTRYEFTWLGQLKIWTMSESYLATAIKAGKLRGIVTHHAGQFASDEVEITDTTEHLAAFVAAADQAKLFENLYGTFRRIASK